MSQARKAEAGHDLAGVRVLVVEDDFIIFMSMESTLLEAGAEVAYCRSLAEARAFLGPIPAPPPGQNGRHPRRAAEREHVLAFGL